MPLKLPNFRLSFQGKVLIPVIVLLVLLPAMTVVLIERTSHSQLIREAHQTLQTADAVFKNSLEIRSRYLLSRYLNIAADPRGYAIAGLGDKRTMSTYLSEVLEELRGDAEVILFIRPNGDLLASERWETTLNIHDFHVAAESGISMALEGEAQSSLIGINNQLYNAITIPAMANNNFFGVFAIGVRVGQAAIKELTSLTGGEIVLFSNGNVVASTLPGDDWKVPLVSIVNDHADGFRRNSQAEELVLQKTHYLAMPQTFPSTTGRAANYVILSSYEEALQQLEETQSSLWLLSCLGVVASAFVVWLAIGRIMKPLHQLHSMVEAVGRGDFSQRVRVRSADEVAQLANAFNQMTKNLQSSRIELQGTLERLKTTQAQLVQSEKLSAVGEFVAGIAHELNNPLTSVIGFAELLKQANLEPKHQNFVTYIVKSSERCHKIVQGLLSFSRQHTPERKVLNLNDVVGGVLELLSYEMRTSNIEVKTDLHANLPLVTGDAHQLQQVFLNMLNNARQAIEMNKPSGKIHIRTDATRGHVRIIFQDNGPGIPKENQSKIFDPFFTTKPVGKGTGLGLSLCYGIIQEHSGTISIHSEPGCGAVFIIELPIAQAAEQLTVDQSDARNGHVDGSGKRVLVIDDEEWILELVSQILRRDGYRVDTAQNGSVALEQVSRSNYELLVCDWKMPGISGPQLYDRLSTVSPEAAGRVIFMTGDVVSDTFQTFLQKHHKTCLSKPFSVQEFRHAVHEFMARN